MNIRLFGGQVLNYLYNEVITHIPIHSLRKGFLRLFNKKIDKSAVILMHVRILNFWNAEIGPRVVINQYCLLDCRIVPIIMKSNADLAPYCRIWTTGHNPDDPEHGLYSAPVVIEEHAWVASSVTILPGVTIGRGAVVAATSLVHKNVEPMAVVGGNPARFIRKRDNPLTYKLTYKPFLE